MKIDKFILYSASSELKLNVFRCFTVHAALISTTYDIAYHVYAAFMALVDCVFPGFHWFPIYDSLSTV